MVKNHVGNLAGGLLVCRLPMPQRGDVRLREHLFFCYFRVFTGPLRVLMTRAAVLWTTHAVPPI
jgi:hypothetical protein